MKNFKLMLATMMLAMSVTASAQFANQSSKGSNKSSGGSDSSVLVKDCENYNRISLSYAPLNLTPYYGSKSYDSKTLNGFKLGWTGGYSVSQKLPFFIETGLDLSFNTKSVKGDVDLEDDYYYDDDDEESDFKTRQTTMALTVPVNVTYKLAFKNGFYLSPYFGLHFKVNVLGKTKMKYDGDDDYDYYYYDDDNDDSNTSNWFSEKDMGKNGTYNRFQMGWRIGSYVGYKNVSLNVGYAGDFIPLYKYKKSKITSGGVVIGVGITL